MSTKLLTALFLFILFIANAAAQSGQRIDGTVTDAAGAVIAGATVTVKNEQTGESRTVTAASDGTFTVLGLQPAKYTITTSANGFETANKTGVELLVGQTMNLDLVLGLKGLAV